MFQIDDTIISEAVLEEAFVCDLNACKGVCCEAGDAGAPLDKNEIPILEEVYEKVKPFLRDEGVAAIEKQGLFVKSEFDELETPLVNGKECAYVIYQDDQTASCGIEKAFREGLIDWKKPVSCHLYPIRIQKYQSFTAVNYDKWEICAPACSLGSQLKVPVYKFVKEALVRKFGTDWYQKVELAAQHHKENL